MNKASLKDKLWVATFIVAVASDVLSGVIRYYTSTMGMAPAAYLPKVLMLGWVLYVLLTRPKATHALIALYLLTQTFLSLSHGVEPAAVGFWLWSVTPLLFALTASRETLALMNRRSAFLGLLTLAALCGIGILANSMLKLPWVGASVSVGGHNVTMATSSYVGVASRLSGFGRDSASVALMAGLLTTWLLMHIRSKALQFVLLALAGATIYATTNKTAPVSLAIVVIVHMLFSTRGIKRACLWASGFPIVLPIVAFFAASAFNLASRGYVTLSSFQDRMINTWPLLIEGLMKHERIWFGLGPGAFGSAASYYESPFGFNVAYADNTVLYAIACFGFVGALVLVVYLVRLMLNSASNDRAAWSVLLYLVFSAASTDICESIGCLLFLGLAISYLRQPALMARPVAPWYPQAPSRGYGFNGFAPQSNEHWLQASRANQQVAALEASRHTFGRHSS
ncbi:hypothetical protein P9250_01530 [Caballeronia sp. LP006]|uniref:hypothetical protein n=1 Tax=Caballeronia sp. LP006 TaxID=3038552 RepID=UPI00285CC5FC|nr:hypothetical protein [Caballeronia sp. LP006]MDR5826530.1 hypothetical protein [Caballeronia sp. LP006]